MNQTPQPPPPKRRMSRWFWVALILPVVALELTSLLGGRHHAQPADAQALRVERAGIWLAWSMVGLLVFMGLLVGAMVWRFRKLSRNPDPGLALLDELYQQSLADERERKHPGASRPLQETDESLNGPPATGAPPAWEKPGDWWQKE